MPVMTANAYFGMAVESTYGVAAASITTLTPITSPKVTSGDDYQRDDYRREPALPACQHPTT